MRRTIILKMLNASIGEGNWVRGQYIVTHNKSSEMCDDYVTIRKATPYEIELDKIVRILGGEENEY